MVNVGKYTIPMEHLDMETQWKQKPTNLPPTRSPKRSPIIETFPSIQRFEGDNKYHEVNSHTIQYIYLIF